MWVVRVGAGGGVRPRMLRVGWLLGVRWAGTMAVIRGGVMGELTACLQALGDSVDPVGYAGLSGHVPLEGLGGVIVLGHVLVQWRDDD